jgi:hypothetical protein
MEQARHGDELVERALPDHPAALRHHDAVRDGG